MLTFP